MLSAYKILHSTDVEHIEPCDHLCMQVMQTTIEYFRLHKVKTQIAASHLYGVSRSVYPSITICFLVSQRWANGIQFNVLAAVTEYGTFEGA